MIQNIALALLVWLAVWFLYGFVKGMWRAHREP